MNSTQQVADWIETGLAQKDVSESRIVYLDLLQGNYTACVLGLALIGKWHNSTIAAHNFREHQCPFEGENQTLARLIGISGHLARALERLHYRRTATEIVGILRHHH